MGYNLYRSLTPGGPLTQVNSALIPAEKSGLNEGFPYTFDDLKVDRSVVYYYYLEVVYIDNHTAIEAMTSARIPTDIYLPLVFQDVTIDLNARNGGIRSS